MGEAIPATPLRSSEHHRQIRVTLIFNLLTTKLTGDHLYQLAASNWFIFSKYPDHKFGNRRTDGQTSEWTTWEHGRQTLKTSPMEITEFHRCKQNILLAMPCLSEHSVGYTWSCLVHFNNYAITDTSWSVLQLSLLMPHWENSAICVRLKRQLSPVVRRLHAVAMSFCLSICLSHETHRPWSGRCSCGPVAVCTPPSLSQIFLPPWITNPPREIFACTRGLLMASINMPHLLNIIFF